MIKRGWLILFSLLFFFATASAASEAVVYVVPIHGDINGVQYSIVKEAIQEAESQKAAAIVFDIDTYGGYVQSAEMIKNEIINTELPTLSFVNNKAESAGVLIAIASETLVMNQSATIGSAETIPKNEKVLSVWVSMLRDAAQYRGRNPDVVVSMADADKELEGVIERGRLLNLTTDEAESIGFIDYSATSVEDLLSQAEIEYTQIKSPDISASNTIAGFLTNPIVNTLMLIMGFVGAVVELFMPGFGLGGILSILGFGLFFAGNILSGNAELLSLLLFILGAILIFVEMLIPGFGLPGISGILLLLAGIVLAMKDLTSGILSLSIAIITATIVGGIIVKRGFSSPLFNRIILNKNLKKESVIPATLSVSNLIGKQGKSLTILRPSGTVEIEGVKYDALTEGEFIPRDTDIEVLRIVGAKIFVRRK
ncbi:MAG: NfeD family protein [Tissierellia bacterium]|nr:NfeD family protein [Tissierellia bacterium]